MFKKIIYCPRHITEHVGKYHTRMYMEYESSLKKIINQLTSIKNYKLIVKLHPAYNAHNDVIKKIINKINSDILIFYTKKIDELIVKSDLVVVLAPDGFDPSTVLLESIILKKPIINFVLDEKFFDFSYEQHNAVISITKKDNLKEIIFNIFNDLEFKNKLIENGKKFLDDYLSNHKMAAEILAKKLDKL